MKTLIISCAVFLLSAFTLTSCKKDSGSGGGGGNNNPASFTWKENNGAVITADSAKWTVGTNWSGVRAWKAGTPGYFFEINWQPGNDSTPGTKTLTTSGGNTYISGSSAKTLNSNSTLNVTSCSGGKMSGNFSGTFNGGGSSVNITAEFNNIPKY